MKVIYNNVIPVRGFMSIMLFGVLFVRSAYRGMVSKTVLNHEEIHCAQAKEVGGYLWFYFAYLYMWVRYWGYMNIPFEKEAYANEKNLEYLQSRKRNAWKSYR